VLTLPRHGARLEGASPIPVDPGEDASAALELTQPIEVPGPSGRAGSGS
jgi:two-component system, OmpR family, sensor histidine kinase MtrB